MCCSLAVTILYLGKIEIVLCSYERMTRWARKLAMVGGFILGRCAADLRCLGEVVTNCLGRGPHSEI